MFVVFNLHHSYWIKTPKTDYDEVHHHFFGRDSTMTRRSWTVIVLPANTDCRRFCRFLFVFSFVSFCTVPLQCLWHDSVISISTLLLTAQQNVYNSCRIHIYVVPASVIFLIARVCCSVVLTIATLWKTVATVVMKLSQ